MTLYQAATETRKILKSHDGNTIPAIRHLRQQGLSFKTAKTMVLEIKANAPWWKSAK
jgi:hypothetical protein